MTIIATPKIPDYVQLRRRRVKNMRMQIDSQRIVTLILPQNMPEREAHGWFWHKKDWVDRKRAEIAELEQSVAPMSVDRILLHGELMTWQRLSPDVHLSGAAWGQLNQEQQQLLSPLDLSKPELRRLWYRNYAADVLPPRLRELAERVGMPVNRISVRDQKTRWGSCSSQHNISLNWRLVQMPPKVSDYVMLHELAHTQHMNHGAEFWAVVEDIHGDPSEEIAWLKTEGRVLRQFDGAEAQ